MIPPVLDLAAARAHDRVVFADVRYYLDGRRGRDAYDRGHLPGAVFVDVDEDLAAHGAPPTEGRHPLPDPEAFAARMSQLGVADQDLVVAYDDSGGVMAARLVWMLRATGHEAALLDGGLAAYPEELETEPPTRTPAVFTARPWPTGRLATIDEAADRRNTVVDARAPERFRGDSEPIDPRAGHIPGARNVPCRDHVDANGRFKSVAEIRRNFVGIEPGTDVISYCGSGVTACHNLLALEYAGLGVGRLYPGSWSAYSNTDRPAETA
jgi:thiosulfate/3-mercaptopyruvate sulfurtransferase